MLVDVVLIDVDRPEAFFPGITATAHVTLPRSCAGDRSTTQGRPLSVEQTTPSADGRPQPKLKPIGRRKAELRSFRPHLDVGLAPKESVAASLPLAWLIGRLV